MHTVKIISAKTEMWLWHGMKQLLCSAKAGWKRKGEEIEILIAKSGNSESSM